MVRHARPAEVQQSHRNALATKRLAANQAEIVTQVFKSRRTIKCTFVNARFERFGTRRDRCERVVDLMYDPRRETSDACKFLSPRDRPVRLHSIRYLFAACDHVTDASGRVGPHRDLADDPVTDVAFIVWRLLFNAFDFAALEHAFKFVFEDVARLAG